MFESNIRVPNNMIRKMMQFGSAEVILSGIINGTKLMFKEQLFLPLWLKEIVTTINWGGSLFLIAVKQ